MLSENASEVCFDPRSSNTEVEERDGIWSAFTAMWFFYDTDANGFIEAHDVRAAFAAMDFWSNGRIDRTSVESVTDGVALELCFEAAIASDSEDSDSDCDIDEDDWISRKRRCGPEETTFWNSRGRNLQRGYGGLFDVLDQDKDGLLTVFEFYYPFGEADTNVDYMIDPEELMEWLQEHEYSICAPFEDVIDEVISALNDEFDNEEEFAQIFTEN
jgi:hypothetical protein